MRACRLLSPKSSCHLNTKLSSSLFDVSTIAVKRWTGDPLVLCCKMEIPVCTKVPCIITVLTVE